MAVLIEAREKAGLSQRQISARLKRAAIFCHRIETGELMLPAPELPDYAEALGVDVHELIKRWLELDGSGRLIPKRQDARRNNKIIRKKSA